MEQTVSASSAHGASSSSYIDEKPPVIRITGAVMKIEARRVHLKPSTASFSLIKCMEPRLSFKNPVVFLRCTNELRPDDLVSYVGKIVETWIQPQRYRFIKSGEIREGVSFILIGIKALN